MFDLIIRILITVVLVAFGAAMVMLFITMLKLALEDRKKQNEEDK